MGAVTRKLNGMYFSVEADKSDIRRATLMLMGVKKGTNPAMARAINRTLTTVRKDAADEVAREIAAKKTVIKAHMKLKKAFKTNPVGWLECSGERLNLIYFGAPRQTKAGVTVKVYQRQGRRLYKHAFIADIGGGKEYKNDPRFSGVTISRLGGQVYMRKYKGGKAVKPNMEYGILPFEYRWPVYNLKGPAVPDVLADDMVMTPIMAKANEKFNKNFRHEVNFMLSKL